MTLPIEVGVAVDVLVGPVLNSSTNAVKNDLAYNASGMVLSTYIGSTRAARTLSGTTDADWWWRSAGGEGMYLLRVPASVLTSGEDGLALRVRGVATGVFTFSNFESLQIVDPTVADTLSAILALSDDEVGIKSDPASAGATLTAIPWNAAWDAEVQSEVADALGVYDPPTKAELDTAVSGLSTLSSSDITTILDTVIPDSVPADGSRPTVRQALYLLVQYFTERQISGTSLIVRKPDGVTTLMTLQFDNANAPLSITRVG